jgi:hypothetical protein
LPKGYQTPEVIQQGIVKKDETIARLKADLKARDDANKRFEPIERALANLGEQQQPTRPDPIDDPDGYANWVWDGADKRATERSKQHGETIGAVSTLMELCRDGEGNVNQEKYEKVLAHMREQGWITHQGDEFFMKPNLARAAYKDVFFDEAIAAAKGEGLDTVNETLRNASNAPGSIPATGAQNAPAYRSLDELYVNDPVEFERQLREINEKS